MQGGRPSSSSPSAGSLLPPSASPLSPAARLRILCPRCSLRCSWCLSSSSITSSIFSTFFSSLFRSSLPSSFSSTLFSSFFSRLSSFLLPRVRSLASPVPPVGRDAFAADTGAGSSIPTSMANAKTSAKASAVATASVSCLRRESVTPLSAACHTKCSGPEDGEEAPPCSEPARASDGQPDSSLRRSMLPWMEPSTSARRQPRTPCLMRSDSDQRP
mmetsp:Transcript_91267/g.258468  ORF Transcript_91267/g.258468 Transcript_91267/m.258468 type:complete len:216 (+) Transcript_91267:433-1080(+)